MKLLLTLLFALSQFMLPAQNISLQLGHSLWPAEHIGLRYEHWTNGPINFSVGGFYQRSHDKRLDYSNYGVDLLAEWLANRGAEALPLINIRLGFGATWQTENEPWLYKDLSFSERMNYGVLCETSLDCNLTENFRLNLFAQQKYLIRRRPGNAAPCFGLGLGWRLGQY
jgi:hypothetical protein